MSSAGSVILKCTRLAQPNPLGITNIVGCEAHLYLFDFLLCAAATGRNHGVFAVQ